jgi:membrane associated rhomboid family serine protease
MLIPTGHENLEGRRWPWITIAIILLNVVAFGASYSSMDSDSERGAEVRIKTLLLAAWHPQVTKTPAQQKLVESFQKSNPRVWAIMEDENRRPESRWDIEMREYDHQQANEEMAALDAQLAEVQRTSVLERYAFFSDKRDAYRYVTSSFLHGGWFHIIFNMWFLWLAGSVMEDAWGRAIYPVFYGLACFVSLFAHGTAHPDSIKAVIGASGAVAALMGAFLVRFFSTRINFLLIFFWGFIPRFYRFQAAAWVMLPLWLGIQVFWGLMIGEDGGVAYWSHVGGFVFGTVTALGMKFSGMEKKVDAAIEAEVGWSSDPRVVRAGEILTRDPQGALAELQAVLAEHPQNLEALSLLAKAQWQAGQIEPSRETLAQLAKIHIKKREFEHALENFDEYRHSGGEKFPAAEWLAVCRHLENVPNYERAAAEYEAYAAAWPAERMSVYALVAAGRIQLKNLNNKSEAARLYRLADASAVPHLDWEEAIKKGLREAAAPAPVTV